MSLEPTIWAGDGGEFTDEGVATLADASGFDIADASGDLLADSGQVFVPLAATQWLEDDGL